MVLDPLIELRDVNKYYGELHVLQDVDLTVGKGEVVVVIGPSGSGKSTLCRAINRLEQADRRSRELLDRVGLADQAGKFPAQLSGGRQQRVAIARALAMEPKALLFDEPTSALDAEMIDEFLEVMGQLAREGVTMVVVTHEMGFARSAAHRVVFMSDGRVVEDRAPEDFFTAPESERARDFLSKILKH
ncbi:amino acid ABC transporter ATP-binding protein [Streptomyces sp. NPDC052415]|uniref:amino acid ABC transporter ATP-binding protein n=1 Tax=Streptomyces sp. NPDC052415 TaxID=3365690 RepID=UPI0037D7F2A4